MTLCHRTVSAFFPVGVYLLLAGSAARADLIDFDHDAFGNPLTAPSLFSNTTHLAELYAPLGVHFNGPGIRDGGAILDQDGNFGVNARSGRNFLAFNRNPTVFMMDGGLPRDPETIRFDFTVSAVSIWAAGGFDRGTFRLDAFDAMGNLVGSDTVAVPARTYQELQVSGEGVVRVVVSELSGINSFVYDDLAYTPVPEPSTWALLGLGALGLVGYGWRRRKAAW